MNKIQETINQLFIATDQQQWQRVEQCFAENVKLDYSSMTGQPAADMSPQQITESWKGILPGFDHTHHQTGNFIVKQDGDKATAFCYGTATHFLDTEKEKVWTVVGTYDFDLKKKGEGWRISTMTFNFKYQSGNLDLPQIAISRLNDHSTSISERNKNSVRLFFKALESKDVDALVSLFAENARHLNPYHSGLFPEGVNGRQNIRIYWQTAFSNFDDMAFPIEEIHAMEDPNKVFVKYRGLIERKDGAGIYENNYYSTFVFKPEGEILEYVEIFNPLTAAKGFGLLDKIK